MNSPGLATARPEPRRSSANVAARLAEMAERMPEAVAIAEPGRRGKRRTYRTVSFRELDRDSDVLARGLRELGITPGTRIALLVRPGIDFIALVFALFKVGAVAILIDPGMGRRRLVSSLAEARPEGFIAIPLAQAVRRLLRSRFPLAQYNVTVGRRLFWDGTTIEHLRRQPWAGAELATTDPDTPAAIIFTTGSTGPAKGVLYCHGNFNRQVDELREQYDIRPGEIDLAAFPLFGLFNCALGVTTVIPVMDASRPARVNPRRIVEAVEDWHVTQAFGSPAIWNRVGRYCTSRRVRLGSLRRVLSAGAPVPPEVLAHMKACLPDDGQMHTPYGATEALPVASIEASEVL
ncbi:MAG TPA: AMP-binding protein, partial [Pirellulales bacterium]|nr:AMP-binding protein [Pirellulales bacterium]